MDTDDMILSCCIIVKDDSLLGYLKNAVNSLIDYVDEVCITANGEEVDKIKDWCSKNSKIKYSYLPWKKDFAEQRNFNFSQARPDADYLMWIDADDILVHPEELPKLAQKAKDQELDCVYMTYLYSCTFDGERTFDNLKRIDIKQERERLLNPRKIRWVGKLHETPLQYEGVKFTHAAYKYGEESPMVVLHTGAWTDEPKSLSLARNARNQEILEIQLEEERAKGKADPRTILYLMKIYAYLEDDELHKKNLKLGPEYIANSGWDEEIATCWLLMAKSAGHFNEWESAEKYIYQAMKSYPNRVETYLRLAEAEFFLNKHKDMKHWMDIALEMEQHHETASVDNQHLNSLLAAELTVRYYYDVERNLRKAHKAAEMVYELNPNEITEERMETLRQLANLDVACEHVDMLCRYFIEQKDKKAVLDLLQRLPQSIQLQPFSLNLLKKYQKPKIWESDEICYFANFGGPSIEEWSPASLSKGLGGSETAVIELSRKWASLGYRVTVYGDPGKDIGIIDGVTYLPYFYFNKKDKFNIFIQWRDSSLSDKISAKKFYVDLHDVTNSANFKNVTSIDKIFVKSKAHRNLLPRIPDSKIKIISNGI